MPPCNCHPPFPRPEPFSPLPRPGKTPDWGKWIRDRLSEKGALLVFPTRASFPNPGAWPNLYLDLETGAIYRWDREDYAVLVDPREGNDVLVYDSVAAFPDEGEQGKLYIAANTGSLYRWGGEGYVALLPGKADKAVPQTAGNFAALTQDGNLADSRKKPSDFATAAQGAKADTAVQSIVVGSSTVTPGEGGALALPVSSSATLGSETTIATSKAVKAVNDKVTVIEGKIPSQASASNQLADKEFVNSSIATETAAFRGAFNLVADLELPLDATHERVAMAVKTKLGQTAYDKNDYVFVQIPQDAEHTDAMKQVDRYKCVETGTDPVVKSWEYEWTLNNSSFTAEQWAAINSGITSGAVAQLVHKRDYTDRSYNTQVTVNAPALHAILTLRGTQTLEYYLPCTEDIPATPEINHAYFWRRDGAEFFIVQDVSALTTIWTLLYSSTGEWLASTTTDNATQGYFPDLTFELPAYAAVTSTKVNSYPDEVQDALALDSNVPAPSTATPAMDGTGAAGTSAAFARGDHVHPTDTSRMAASATGADIPVDATVGAQKINAALAGKASKADATLNGRGVDGSGFSAWTCEINGQVVVPESIMYDEAGVWTFDLGPEDYPIQISGDENSTELTKVILDQTFTATRTALPGYRLGPDDQSNPNRDKPLASEAEAEALRTNVAGKYTKPETGIPKIDLAEGIQASLDKADTAPIVLDVARHSRITVGDVEFEVVLYWNSGARDRFFMAAQRVGTWLTQSGEWQSSAEAYTHTWESGGVTYTATRAAGNYFTPVYINGVESSLNNIASRCAGQDLGTTAKAFYDTLNAYFATCDGDGNRISDTYARKASPGHAGNLAALDANGNPTDSGKKPSDFQPKLTFDTTPTAGSHNPVTSGGIKDAIDAATPEDYAQVKAQVQTNTGDIANIKAVVPSAATAQNKLVDTQTMNSSIATNTANFLGTYSYVTDLGFPQPSSAADVDNDAIATALGTLTYAQTPTNNDYVFVSINYTPTTDVDEFRRFKYNDTTHAWAYEYTLNNSSFTAAQWAAINSGVTSGLVAKLGDLPTAAELTQALSGKLDASNGVATGLVTYLGTFNGFEYGLRFGSYGSDYAVQIVARSAGQQSSWQATANLMVQKSKTGYAALLSDIPNVPNPSTSTPLMDGTGAAGTSAAFARGDHVHPTDTSRVPTSRTVNGKALSSDVTLDADDVGAYPATDAGEGEYESDKDLYVNGRTRGEHVQARSPSNDTDWCDVATLLHIADEFDPQEQYAKDALVTFRENENWKLYKCVAANGHTGNWNPNDFQEATVEDILAALRTGKADKCVPQTAGNLAALDADGNPTDSTIPAANVAVKGEIPYDRITITTGQLQDHAEQKVTLNAATTTLTLPALTTGKVSDFGIDVVNGYEVSGTPTAASFTLDGTLGSDYNLIVPKGEDWSEMSALAAGEMAVYYFTLSAFQINDKPTWEVMKKVVELVPVPSAP